MWKGANLVLQKGTKERKLSLGSWLDVWVANEICNFLVEFKSLNNEKKKLPYEQALDLCFSYLQKGKFLHLDLSLWNDILYEIIDIRKKNIINYI